MCAQSQKVWQICTNRAYRCWLWDILHYSHNFVWSVTVHFKKQNIIYLLEQKKKCPTCPLGSFALIYSLFLLNASNSLTGHCRFSSVWIINPIYFNTVLVVSRGAGGKFSWVGGGGGGDPLISKQVYSTFISFKCIISQGTICISLTIKLHCGCH